MTEKQLQRKKQIETGFLICKTCNQSRELILFHREIKGDKIYHKIKKCKICIAGKYPNLHKSTLTDTLREPKRIKVKKSNILSPEAKEFIKRVIFMRGYIDSVEAFKLVHYHIETFGYIERLILDVEKELTTMFTELLDLYYKGSKSI